MAPLAATTPAAQAADVTAATCTSIAPATLTATTVWDKGYPVVSFSGTLNDGTPAGSCVKIPVPTDLDARAWGSYPALDKNGDRVGTMVVDQKLITFLIDDSYTATHTDVSFFGTVTFGLTTHYNTTKDAYDYVWTLPGGSTVTIHVPSCPSCGSGTVYSGKFAIIDDKGTQVISGIRSARTCRSPSPTGPPSRSAT